MALEVLMEFLSRFVPAGDILGVSYTGIVYSLVVLIGSVVVAKVLYSVVHGWVVRLTKHTETKMDDEILVAVRKPLYYLIIVFGLVLGLDVFVPVGYLETFNLLATIVEMIIVIWASVKISKIFITYTVEAKTKSKDVAHLLQKLVRILILAMGLMLILGYAGVDITPLIASLGVAGLAIALALQDTLANFFAGIYLTLDKAFKIGDAVELAGGKRGRVLKIGSRSTKIKTFDNITITIPNDELAKTMVANLSGADEIIRNIIKIGVGYDSDPDQVKALLEKIANSEETVLKEPAPAAYFLKFGDSALEFELRFRAKIKDRNISVDKVNTVIIKEFRKAKIEIPFPIRTVYMNK